MSLGLFHTSWPGRSCTAVGPWGGQSGYRWDDGIYSSVKQILITSAAAIDSIQFEYDENGHSIWSDKHGGTGGLKTFKIKLNFPSEFLVSVSGHCGPLREGDPVIVRSIYLESNWKTYGPFGIEEGMPFSLPISGGKLVGFHGRSSWYLDAIGVYLMPLIPKNPVQMITTPHRQIVYEVDPKISDHEIDYIIDKIERNKFWTEKVPRDGVNKVNTRLPINKRIMSFGPWGADSGTSFDDGVYTGVREVHITRSGGLVSIRVCYDQNGKAVWGKKNGGTGGLKLDKIVFYYPFEQLTRISGYYGSTILRGPTIVKSITFHTTKRIYGPFGDPQGFGFSSGTNGVIVGFHGRNGYFVNSIGVHVLEGKPLIPQPYPDPFDMSTMNNKAVLGIFDMGPWGGEGGLPWDDGVFAGVRSITLTRSGEAICSIQIEYDQNGRSLWGAQHGAGNEACTHFVKFNYPYEVLKSVSGYYDALYGDRHNMVVRSLSFLTNRAKYGPYGKEMGTYFSSSKVQGTVIGFHGMSRKLVDGIGVHMECSLDDEVSPSGYDPERGVIRNILNRIVH